jgi:hypothetical protein
MTTTLNDWVEKVWRRVYSNSPDNTVQLLNAVGINDTTITVTPTSATSMRANIILAIDYEIVYVTNWNSASGTATIVRSYLGSTAATHTANTLVYVQPKYTRFDVAVTLNDELNRLSSPDMGMFQIGVSTVTYNPVYMGYDLGSIPTNFLDVLEIRHKIPFPTRNYPKISKWKVLRSIPDSTVFPSGAGIVIYEGGYPGQPFYIQYSAPYTPVDLTVLANYTADLTTITGLQATALDIPPLGAEIQLTLPREIKRNFMESQPDPRKAPEVPSLAVSNSVQAMQILYTNRVTEEAARLTRQYTRTEGW